jgi:signal peptidase I
VPGSAAPGSASPGYGPNGYGPNGYEQSAYNAPRSAQPGYGAPASAQPSYGAPASAPPAYGENGYRANGYQETAYTDTGSRGNGWSEPGSRATSRAREAGYREQGSRDRDEPPRSAPPDQPKGRGFRKSMPLWQELPLLLVVAFCLAVLIRTFLLQAFFIPSGSMENTLLIGDRVLVNKVVYDLRDPQRGEVVVFRGPDNWVPETPTTVKGGFVAKLGRTIGDLVGVSAPGEKDFIKRVIGVPGDTVACCDPQGRVTVNGVALNEPYVTENSPLDVAPTPGECRSRKFNPIVVQPGMLWVMGDHRLVSQDSRCQGQVPIKNVIGRAFVVVWPSSRWANLPVPSTFASVPKPVSAAREGPLSPDLTPLPPSTTGHSAPAKVAASTSDQGTGAVVVPLLLSWYIPARSRRWAHRRQRRLSA